MKKIFGLSLIPPAEVRDCSALDVTSNLPNDKRVEQFCDYLLENEIDADSTFPPPVWSECSAPSVRTINVCESFHVHFNALFYSAHPNIFVPVSALQKIQNETYIKMRSVTTRRLKSQLQSKQRNSSPQKLDSKGLTGFLESNFFHQCRINFYQTHIMFLIACIHNDTCHFCNCACYCTNDNTYNACQTTVS